MNLHSIFHSSSSPGQNIYIFDQLKNELHYHLIFIWWRKVQLQTSIWWKYRKSPGLIFTHLFTIRLKRKDTWKILNLFWSEVNARYDKDIMYLIRETLWKIIRTNQATENQNFVNYTFYGGKAILKKNSHKEWCCQNNC